MNTEQEKKIEQINKEVKILDFQINMETLKWENSKPSYFEKFNEWKSNSYDKINNLLLSQLNTLTNFNSTKLVTYMYEDNYLNILYDNVELVYVSDFKSNQTSVELKHQYKTYDLNDDTLLMLEITIMIFKLCKSELMNMLKEIHNLYQPIQLEAYGISKAELGIKELELKKQLLNKSKELILLVDKLKTDGGGFQFRNTYFSAGPVDSKIIIFHKEEGKFVYYFVDGYQKELFDKYPTYTHLLHKT